MSGAFVIRNQLGHYWGKSSSWVTGERAGQVACWTHRDEAVNTLFEWALKTRILGQSDADRNRGMNFPKIWKSASTPCLNPTRATTLKMMKTAPSMGGTQCFFWSEYDENSVVPGDQSGGLGAGQHHLQPLGLRVSSPITAST